MEKEFKRLKYQLLKMKIQNRADTRKYALLLLDYNNLADILTKINNKKYEKEEEDKYYKNKSVLLFEKNIENSDAHYKVSETVLSALNNESYNFNNYKAKRYTKDEAFYIIKNFIKEFDNDHYEFYENILDNNTYFKEGKFASSAYTFYNLKDNYILFNKNENNINNISTIVHELGHASIFKEKENYDHLYNMNLFFTEVPAFYYELSFLNYLYDNNIDKQYYYKKLNILYYTLIKYFYTIKLSIIANKVSIDTLIDEFSEAKKNYVNIKDNLELVNLTDSYQYGYGILLAIILLKLDKNDYDNFINKYYLNDYDLFQSEYRNQLINHNYGKELKKSTKTLKKAN